MFSKMMRIAPPGSKFFSFEVDLFSEGFGMPKTKQKVTKLERSTSNRLRMLKGICNLSAVSTLLELLCIRSKNVSALIQKIICILIGSKILSFRVYSFKKSLVWLKANGN